MVTSFLGGEVDGGEGGGVATGTRSPELATSLELESLLQEQGQ